MDRPPKKKEVHPEAAKLERDGHIVRIEKPEGDFTILYATHFGDHIQPKEIPTETDALFIEHVSGAGAAATAPRMNRALGFGPYKKIWPELKRRGLPLFIADPDYTQKGLRSNATTERLEKVEGALGVIMMVKAIQAIRSQQGEGVSRRNVLKGLVGSAVGAWMVTPVVATWATVGAYLTETGRGAASAAHKKAREINPIGQAARFTVRELVIAEAQDAVVQQTFNKAGRRADVTTMIGAGHTGLEDAIMATSEQRIAALREFPDEFIDSTFNRESLYTVDRVVWDGDQEKWVIKPLKVPTLHEVFAKKE